MIKKSLFSKSLATFLAISLCGSSFANAQPAENVDDPNMDIEWIKVNDEPKDSNESSLIDWALWAKRGAVVLVGGALVFIGKRVLKRPGNQAPQLDGAAAVGAGAGVAPAAVAPAAVAPAGTPARTRPIRAAGNNSPYSPQNRQ